MNYSSDLNRLDNSNGSHFSKLLRIFQEILDILRKFEDNYEKKLNFTKLLELFNISSEHIDEIISFFLKTQDVFDNIFNNHQLITKKENNYVYLISKRKIPNKITFTIAQINLLNDLIYTFKQIRRGRGFDISQEDTKLHSNIKSLRDEHPYLFEEKENGLLYPSSFGLELGDLIISYNNANKKIREIDVNSYKIVVKNN